jgi:hypothetical protein
MDTIAIIVSDDGKTTMPAAGSRIVRVDPDQYRTEAASVPDGAEQVLTLPEDGELDGLAAAFRDPPEGTPDSQLLAFTSMMLDTAFGIGGLDESYQLVPALCDGKVVLTFCERTKFGMFPHAELWPSREDYTPIPSDGRGEDSEPLLSQPGLPPLSIAIFPRYCDGSTSDEISQVDAATPTALLLTLADAFKQVAEGIYDPASEETPENRAIGVDVTLILAG